MTQLPVHREVLQVHGARRGYRQAENVRTTIIVKRRVYIAHTSIGYYLGYIRARLPGVYMRAGVWVIRPFESGRRDLIPVRCIRRWPGGRDNRPKK